MKTIILAFLMALTLQVAGQKSLDITIIGTAHHFSDEYKSAQNFTEVQNFIVDLNPDIICIEAIPTSDTLSLKEVYPKTMRRADQLRDSLIHEKAFPIYENELSQAGVSAFWQAYGSNYPLLIGASFFASYDFWNAYYYWHNAETKGDSLGYFSEFYAKLNNSEYGLIVFPAAAKLGIKKFYGIDYRAGENTFLEHNSQVLKKLLFRFKWKPLRTYLKTQKRYKKAQEEGKLIAYINGDEFQNSFSNLIDELPQKLPRSEEAAAIKTYWYKRNQIMAQRIVETANSQGAEKVLLTVGSAHVTHIKRFLEEQGHSVTTYGEVLNAKTQ